jgi:hypothetical protein
MITPTMHINIQIDAFIYVNTAIPIRKLALTNWPEIRRLLSLNQFYIKGANIAPTTLAIAIA